MRWHYVWGHTHWPQSTMKRKSNQTWQFLYYRIHTTVFYLQHVKISRSLLIVRYHLLSGQRTVTIYKLTTSTEFHYIVHVYIYIYMLSWLLIYQSLMSRIMYLYVYLHNYFITMLYIYAYIPICYMF